MWKCILQLVVLGVIGGVAAESYGQIHIGGLLRDEYALALTPTIKSAGMGGAYVGIDNNMSINPAALGGSTGLEGSLSYRFYDHDWGPAAHRGRMDAILPNPFPDLIDLQAYQSLTLRLMLDGYMSDGAGATRLLENPEVEFDSFTVGLQAGFDVFDWLSFGFGAYPYEKANVQLGPYDGDALSQIGSIELGTLIKPSKWVHFGAQFIYIKDDLEVDLPDGTHGGDYFHIDYYSIGAAIMPVDGTLIAIDWWGGEIEGLVDPVTKFDQDVDRWNVGIQQRVCDYFDLRLGSKNGGLTTGFTIHVNEKIDVDYAYINQELRDLENVLGDTQFHGISVSAKF